MRLTIEVVGGEKVVERDLLRFSDNLADPILAMQEIATALRAAELRQFDTQGANSGGWARLQQSTIDEKVSKDEDPRILRATERLRKSLINKFDADHIEEPLSADSLRFGSSVPYGIYHQTGTSRTPKRPPLALSDADKIGIVKVVQKALLAGVKG